MCRRGWLCICALTHLVRFKPIDTNVNICDVCVACVCHYDISLWRSLVGVGPITFFAYWTNLWLYCRGSSPLVCLLIHFLPSFQLTCPSLWVCSVGVCCCDACPSPWVPLKGHFKSENNAATSQSPLRGIGTQMSVLPWGVFCLAGFLGLLCDES